MSGGTLFREQALLVAEAWQNLYANQSYNNFANYSQDNLVNAVLNYVKINYPDNFNDWITNSEFVIKVRTMAWLFQSLNYRLDLNIRENFISTATRRQSILNLAENVFYVPNRVTGASGQLRVASVMTNQPLVDSNGDSIANVTINWNDPANVDWFEQFMLVMNSALTPRTQFGHPLSQFKQSPSSAALYILNSRAPSNGVYPFSVSVAGTSLPFGFINVTMDPTTGVLSELAPNSTNAQRILYLSDGLGSGSSGTGFFLPIRQGTLNSLNQIFSTPQPLQTVTLGTVNCDNDTIFVQQLDTSGNVILNWTKVDTLYGQSVAFNNLNVQSIFEVHTLINDQIEVIFGDGKFGAIPTDNFKFWYRIVNPIPIAIQPTDISNQIFVIPYVSNNIVYFLTIAATLVAPISNGIPTDSNANIVSAMGGAFAAQNRMVTGQDYNLFPLRDPSILKLNAVNRTYSGHSAYSKITDPTGFYSGVKLLGEDGRLFRLPNLTSQIVSALTSQITLDELVLQYLTPLIQDPDKTELYYEQYNEILTTGNPIWIDLSDSFGLSRGNIEKSTIIIPVGPTAIDEFRYLIPGTYVRYNDLSGPLVVADTIVGDGTAPGAITLDAALFASTPIFSLMPPLRNQFSNAEMAAIEGQLFNLQDFGITWNQTTQSWNVITNANLNKTGNFSIQDQGDLSNSKLDASWFVYFTYIPNGNDGPQWEIIDRGLGIYFESARDIDFVYANTGTLVDPNTGKLVRDNVNILGVNEGRDSLNRLGLFTFGPCCPIIYNFTSDGITTCYNIRQRVDPSTILIYVNNTVIIGGYTVSITPIGQEICFVSAPTLGATISIRIEEPTSSQFLIKSYADGVELFFPIGAEVINSNNTFFFEDGIAQSLLDYTTPTISGVADFYCTPAIEAGVRVLGYAISNNQIVFRISFYLGDATTIDFSTNCISASQSINTIVVFLDGVMQTPNLDYTIDISSAQYALVVFKVAPAMGSRVILHAPPIPTGIQSAFYSNIGDGVTSSYTYSNFNAITASQVIVSLDGIVQWVVDDYNINSAGIVFVVAPLAGQRIDVFVIYSFNIVNNSCYVTYLLNDYLWNCVAAELTPDGYTDIHGIQVAPVDSRFNGYADDPFEFADILIPDGITDLVLWQSIIDHGFSVWNPIDATTIPKGTYGFENRSGISPGIPFINTGRLVNDIHLDQTINQWLIADPISGNWIISPTQSNYRYATGRSGLYFIWTHYPANDTRIDPAISNIIDMFILTVGYDTAYRTWITSGFPGTEPQPPTSESLQNAYGYLNNFRMTDDVIIPHSMIYLPLFGVVAAPDNQGTFLAIQTSGSVLSENDLKLRIINAIDIFFQSQYFNPGESFYLTELIAFIHRGCAPDLQSIVMIAKDGAAFGTLFQIRAAPDQLFISVAQPTDITLVSSFDNQNLQIGTL
jgi:hypothetical protein